MKGLTLLDDGGFRLFEPQFNYQYMSDPSSLNISSEIRIVRSNCKPQEIPFKRAEAR